MKKIYNGLGYYFIKIVGKRYLHYYPLDETLVKDIKKYSISSEDRINEINDIRLNNIIGCLWTNSGAVFALLITLISLMFSIFWSSTIFINYLDVKHKIAIIITLLVFISLLFLVFYVAVSLTPILLRKIILNLPPREYAEISLSNLSQSEILTFVSYKMWLIAHTFTKDIEIYDSLKQLIGNDNENFDYSFFEEREFNESKYKILNAKKKKQDKSTLLKDITKIEKTIIEFKSQYYDELQKCQALKKEAVNKLGIMPREFTNHILKFSSSIFEVRINNFRNNIGTILYILSQQSKDDNEPIFVVEESIREMFRIYYDIKEQRLRSLRQLIIFSDIHEHLVGLSSVTSTSQSLKIFARGISELIQKLDNNINEKNKIYEEFKSFIHRSKSHYGLDLLILLENFYKKKYANGNVKYDIPEHLLSIKISNSTDIDKLDIINEKKHLLRGIREDIIEHYKDAMSKMNGKFLELIQKIDESKIENLYIMIFGYSRMVRNVIKDNTKILAEKKCKIFVMKEDDTEMLDTRILRFELNDQKPHKNYRQTFTSTDLVFYNLITKNDKVIFIAGIEAFDFEKTRLIHTNKYQKRVENLINELDSAINKPKADIWVIGGDYKIFNNGISNDQSIFGGEFFADHYDKIDYYDFSVLKNDKRFKLISNLDTDCIL